MGVEFVHGRLSDRGVRSSLLGTLRQNVLASFATISPAGRPHIHTAYYAWSAELDLVFYSYPTSRHARNLRTDPSMAASIFDSRQQWGRPDRGVQLFGTAQEATGRLTNLAAETYAARFPGSRLWRKRSESSDGISGVRPYRFRPRRATVFDEESLGEGRFVDVAIPHPNRKAH